MNMYGVLKKFIINYDHSFYKLIRSKNALFSFMHIVLTTASFISITLIVSTEKKPTSNVECRSKDTKRSITLLCQSNVKQ